MASSTRNALGLSQQRVASWLGVPRATLAQVETGRRSLPIGRWMQDARLDLAVRGQVLDPAGHVSDGPPPLPVPPPDAGPLGRRLRECRYHAGRLRYELAELRARAAPYEARYRALPALRAWTGPVPDPAREARWLDSFEKDADYELRYVCGAGPQRLLEARIAGFEREAELLAEMIPPLPAPETNAAGAPDGGAAGAPDGGGGAAHPG